MVGPNAIGSKNVTNLRHQRAPTAMSQKMNRKFDGGMSVQLGKRICRHKNLTDKRRHVVGAGVSVFQISGQRAPIEFDDDFTGGRGRWRTAISASGWRVREISVGSRDGELIGRASVIQCGKTRLHIIWNGIGQRGDPRRVVRIQFEAVSDNRHSSRFHGTRIRRAEQKKKRGQQQVSSRRAKG